MKVALYVRVSTEEQDLEQQRRALEREARRRKWTVVGVYEEKVSGAAKHRPELARLRRDAGMRRFKALLIWSTSRLGRDLLETLVIARELWVERKVALVSFTQQAIDMSTPHGNLVFNIFAAIAEAQRQELVAATKRGMAAARARGVKLGRPPKKLDPGQVAFVVQHNSISFAARAFSCSRATIHRVMKRRPRPTHAPPGGAANPSVQKGTAPASSKKGSKPPKHPTP